MHKRFTRARATFQQAVSEELLTVVIQAEMVRPPMVLRRFSAVVVEDSSDHPAREPGPGVARLWRHSTPYGSRSQNACALGTVA
ncbi:MAG TPA: hypothetical protein VF026_04155 [Ktedonobacteraceae bacterium]